MIGGLLDQGQRTGPRVLYYGAGWPTNIGNAFLDLGAMALLRAALPDAQIGFASEMPRWFFGPGVALRKRWRRWRGEPPAKMDDALDVAAVTECDLVVIAGMAMCEEFVQVNGPTLLALAARGVPTLLMGTGGLVYHAAEKQLFGAFMRQLRPVGFVSRDTRSFELFGEFADEPFDGVDCGFFVSDAYRPFPLTLPPYIAVTFDALPEPPIEHGERQVIRAHHDSWGPIPARYRGTPRTLVSDIPFDYLALYAGAEEVHSDRVHACVAALSYGRPARLYHPTPRGSLFAAAGAPGVPERLTAVDPAQLRARKDAQVAYVRERLARTLKPAER